VKEISSGFSTVLVFPACWRREDHPHAWLLLELIQVSGTGEGIKNYLAGLGERVLEALLVLHQFLPECHFSFLSTR